MGGGWPLPLHIADVRCQPAQQLPAVREGQGVAALWPEPPLAAEALPGGTGGGIGVVRWGWVGNVYALAACRCTLLVHDLNFYDGPLR